MGIATRTSDYVQRVVLCGNDDALDISPRFISCTNVILRMEGKEMRVVYWLAASMLPLLLIGGTIILGETMGWDGIIFSLFWTTVIVAMTSCSIWGISKLGGDK